MKIHKVPGLLNVFISSSRCIYENLAFEEWLFRNNGVNEDSDSLLIWRSLQQTLIGPSPKSAKILTLFHIGPPMKAKSFAVNLVIIIVIDKCDSPFFCQRNSPAVVIGRYQNPWLESDVRFCETNGIQLARRYSGGGAVYHDEGNINVSVLTTHGRHSRKKNLQTVADFLNAELFGGNSAAATAQRLVLNRRDDLLVEPSGAKVSGTAARIAHGRAYHHFTLLVDVDIGTMRRALNSPLNDDDRLLTNASRSVRAKSVGCLAWHLESTDKRTNTKEIVQMVADSVHKAFISQYKSSECVRWNGEIDGFEGLGGILNTLRSEEWIYGKTPKFTLKMNDGGTICVENGLISDSRGEFGIGTSFHDAFMARHF